MRRSSVCFDAPLAMASGRHGGVATICPMMLLFGRCVINREIKRFWRPPLLQTNISIFVSVNILAPDDVTRSQIVAPQELAARACIFGRPFCCRRTRTRPGSGPPCSRPTTSFAAPTPFVRRTARVGQCDRRGRISITASYRHYR